RPATRSQVEALIAALVDEEDYAKRGARAFYCQRLAADQWPEFIAANLVRRRGGSGAGDEAVSRALMEPARPVLLANAAEVSTKLSDLAQARLEVNWAKATEIAGPQRPA